MKLTKIKIIIVVVFLLLLSSCVTERINPETKTRYTTNSNISTSGTVTTENLSLDAKKDLRKATTINAQLSIIYAQENLLDRSKTKLIKAQEMNDKHKYNLAIVNYASGYYYQELGANDIAQKFYKKAVDKHRDDFQALNFYAQFLCNVKHKYAESSSMFEKSLLLPSNNNIGETLVLYADCLALQGKKKDAISYLQKTTSFVQDYPLASFKLAKLYNETSQYKKADAILKKLFNEEADNLYTTNKDILDIKLEVAEKLNHKNEASKIRLILTSGDYNNQDLEDDFYVSSVIDE